MELTKMRRREFLGLTAGGVLAAGLGAYAAGKGHTMRAISYNVLAFRGYPDTNATRTRLEACRDRHPEMTAKALAAFQPDIITLQEGPSEEKVKRFADALNMRYAYFPGGWKGDKAYPGGFPGAIVTRFDIGETENRPSATTPHDGELFTRHLGRARLATPFGPLHMVSAHLHPSQHEVRMREVAAIVDLIAKLRQTCPVLFQGDLNSRPQTPEYEAWVEAGLVDIGKLKGIGDKPTSPSIRPANRIDYIWGTPELAKAAQSAEVLDKPPFVPEPADPSSYALSDHLPVTAEFLIGE